MLEKLFLLASAVAVTFVSQAYAASASQPVIEDTPKSKTKKMFDGVASFYADKFHGRKTASGERFNRNAMTCAHRFLPFGTRLVVQNQANGKTCVVTVNDRGPFCKHRVLDLSPAAARTIGISGISHVICYANTVGSTAKFASQPAINAPLSARSDESEVIPRDDDNCFELTD